MSATITRITEPCLVRIGRSGKETHRGEATYEVKSAGTVREFRRVVSLSAMCRQAEHSGHNARGRRLSLAGSDVSKATCKWCSSKLSQ